MNTARKAAEAEAANHKPLVSQDVAALLLGCSRQFVSQLKQKEKLSGPCHLVAVESIERFLIRHIDEEELARAEALIAAQRSFKAYRLENGGHYSYD